MKEQRGGGILRGRRQNSWDGPQHQKERFPAKKKNHWINLWQTWCFTPSQPTIPSYFNLLAKPKNKDHVSCLHLALRFACGLCLREQESPEFSQSLNLGKSLEFFQVPEPIWRRQKSDSLPRTIGIFPSTRVWEKVQNFLKSHGLYREGRDRNFSEFREYEGCMMKQLSFTPSASDI